MEIKDLVEIFSDHEAKGEENFKKELADFIENNPGLPVPDYLTSYFSLPSALKLMCKEILALKDKIEEKVS